ncbi:MAG: c-type cytochrome biogenesis protein CcmI [Rhodospirillaceae bacterium]|nr:c-type cytochrome biogenesis protein CcmI [Rhodospirillaceae bacterium]
MTLWLILAGIAMVAIILLVAPLWRSPKHNPSRAAFDAQIYRDQLVEVERDADRGQISPEQAATARTEIARRLLAVTEGDAEGNDNASAHMTAEGARDAARASRRGIAVFVGLAVPIAAFGVYMITGSPHLPSQPGLEAQARAPVKTPPAPGEDTAKLVAQLGERLKDRPTDLRGWTLYARTLASLGRFADAATAYQRVITLSPQDAELRSRYAEIQIFAAQGTVSPAARASLEATLALDPKEPRARYYLGLAESQAGKLEEALSIWIGLESESGPDAPWNRLLGVRISRLAARTKVTPDALAARREQAAAKAGKAVTEAPRGPTSEDLKAAQSMTQKDRMGMIRGMVAGLSERLKSNPDDLAGWQRLARSYDVLGEAEKARDAYGHIAKLRPDDPVALAKYAASIARALPRDARIPKELMEIGDRILTLDPRHTGALWFTGVARAQTGDRAGARERWTRLLAELDPKSPQYADVKKSIEALDKTGP